MNKEELIYDESVGNSMTENQINNLVVCPNCGDSKEIGDIASYKNVQYGDVAAMVHEGGNLYCMKCKHEWNHYER